MTKAERMARRMPRMLRSHTAVLSAAVLLIIVLFTILAPVLNLPDPSAVRGKDRFARPSTEHLLGADSMGRDILSNILYGARTSLTISLGSILVALVCGTTIGLVAGYSRGGVEAFLMRSIDTLLCFPPILIAIFVIGFIGPSMLNLTIVIGLLYIPRFARIAHSSTLSIVGMVYIESARAIGASSARTLLHHIFPNILAPLLVQISLGLGQVILTESGLSFLGLGPAPPTPSWGRLISFSRRFMHLSPYGVLWPAIAISVTVIALNLFGDALRDHLDPRLRGEL